MRTSTLTASNGGQSATSLLVRPWMRVAKCLIGVSGFTNQLTGSPMSPSTTGTAASSTRSGGCWPLPSTSTTTKLWLVQSVIVLLALPSDIGTTMPALAVRVAYIVHLEAEGGLQVVARLFGLQAGHHGRPLGDVHDHKTSIARPGGARSGGAAANANAERRARSAATWEWRPGCGPPGWPWWDWRSPPPPRW